MMLPRQLAARPGILCLSLLLATGCQQVQTLMPAPSATSSPEPAETAAISTSTRTNINIIAVTPTPVASSALPQPSPTPLPLPSPNQPADPMPTPPASSPTPTPTPTPLPTPSPTVYSSGSSGGSSGSVTPVSITGVSIMAMARTQLQRGQTLNLYATVNLSNGTSSQDLTWSSSQPTTASVNATGAVTGLRAGTVVITATSQSDSTRQAQVTLTITDPVVTFEGQIVYAANNDLYLMQGSNASPKRLTFSDDREKIGPRLSWDGTRVVYRVRSNDFEWVSTTGTEQPVLYDQPLTDIAPDPYYLFTGEILYQNYDSNNGNIQNLYRYKPDGSIQGFSNYLGRIGTIGGMTPAGIIFYEQFDNGNRIRSSKYNNVSTRVEYGFGNNPKVGMNPDPRLIVYWQNFDIMTSTLAGEISNLTPNTDGSLEYHPAISPDESKIIFVSTRAGQADIFMMDPDGSNVVNLTNTPDVSENFPDWGL